MTARAGGLTRGRLSASNHGWSRPVPPEAHRQRVGVSRHGWSRERFVDWLGQTVITQLIRPEYRPDVEDDQTH